jgi:hypothetical protein
VEVINQDHKPMEEGFAGGGRWGRSGTSLCQFEEKVGIPCDLNGFEIQ